MFGPEPGPASDSQSRAGGIPLRRAAVLGTGLLAACTLLGGCSLEKMAVRSLADTLGSGAETFAEDDDPELVGQALPFALKTFELLLASDPENAGLLLSACSGFTQYAYAYAELEAERAKPVDYRESRRQMERATRLYLRGRDYCLQALELEAPGVGEGLVRRPEATVTEFDVEHLPLLYWTAASWGSAISSALDRPELVVDLPAVRALLDRCLELDEDWQRGTIHDAMIAIEAVPAAMGGSVERARRHYERSLELSADTRVGTHLSWAWLVTIGQQDRNDFEVTLGKALAVDLDASPGDRLANQVNRDFSHFLLDRADELFLEPALDPAEDPP